MRVSSAEYLKRDDLRGLYPGQLNGETARCLGRAACRLLREKCGCGEKPLLGVGYDCRLGSLELAQGLMLGFQEAGGRCLLAGRVSTEHVYYLCGREDLSLDAGVMITASHNPKEYDGMKFVHAGCLPFTHEELAFLGTVADEMMAKDFAVPAMDFARYARDMFALANLDALPDSKETMLRLLVLAGGGMGGVAFTPLAELLKAKGIETTILEGELDGNFPQGVPNPLSPAFMKRLGEATRNVGADLGIGFDGDADRVGFVGANGQEILPAHVFALIAREKVRRTAPGTRPVVMKNLCCSRLIEDLFPANGPVELVETPVGHGRIKLLMRSKEYASRVVFAGEHSGHYFYPEFHFMDSGVLTCLNMIGILRNLRAEAKQSLAGILEGWRKNYHWSGEQNYSMASTEDTKQAMAHVAEKAALLPEGVRYEVRLDADAGVHRVLPAPQGAPYAPAALSAPDLKFRFDQGGHGWWFVLHPSGNESILRLNVEGWGPDSVALCQKGQSLLAGLLRESGANFQTCDTPRST